MSIFGLKTGPPDGKGQVRINSLERRVQAADQCGFSPQSIAVVCPTNSESSGEFGLKQQLPSTFWLGAGMFLRQPHPPAPLKVPCLQAEQAPWEQNLAKSVPRVKDSWDRDL